MKLYKLTNQNKTTHNGYVYGIIGKIHEKKKVENPQLCTKQVFHAYKNLNLGLLLNPIHANIQNPRCFEIEGDVVVEDFGKVGSFKQEVLKELEIPEWYVSENTRKKVQVQFTVLCAEKVLPLFEQKYPEDSRPRKAIEATKAWLKNPCKETVNAAYAAYTAANAATYAANSAANAATYAADAATDAAYAASAATYAAYAAYTAANAATYAANSAANAININIDFSKLADKAVEMITKK